MNHWKETAEIVLRLAELAAAKQRAALATVVHIAGSAYRRPGAKFLIEESGATLGSVSGGCLEADVREVARAVAEGGTPCLRHYHTGAEEDIVWGLGLGCNGLVDVFVQPATFGSLADLAGPLRQLCAGDTAFAVATVIEGGEELGATLAIDATGAVYGSLGTANLDRPAAEHARELLEPKRSIAVRGPGSSAHSAVLDLAGRRLFVEALQPPPHLVVCGAGDDARPLVDYAADAGFRVTVLDHRPALLEPRHFPAAARLAVARPESQDIDLPPAGRSLAVVKTHSLAHDREWVRRLLAAGLPYVGVLGPRERTEAILRDVAVGLGAQAAAGAASAPPAERVFGPVGLDLGADGPRQVALAIVAELLAFVAQREPRHLSERREAIHAG
ncbi:MAG TPA: XdhC family protein [Thermoanaerobaculia bacterium]|nr:XdhC family protein [Thermoanaerobaculia bacterium]